MSLRGDGLQPNSSRLGYYVVGLGLIVQFLGLVSDSWSNGQDGRSSVLSFNDPSDFFLVLGIGVTLLGALFGLLGLSRELAPKLESPRLLPAVPLVLFLGVSLGGLAFAYQAGNNASTAGPEAAAATTPTDCPEGFFWHPTMGHCMSEALVDTSGAPPTCPDGYVWNAQLLVCDATSAAQEPGAEPTPVCPAGYFWHPQMNHCMLSTNATPTCPSGYEWDTSALVCRALNASSTPSDPVCPEGYFWHPQMNHCMALGPTPTPLPTGATPPACPPDTIWHPAMNACMPTVCPIGWQFDYEQFTCVPNATPTATPTPTTTPTPPTGTPTPPTGTPTPTPDETPTPTGTPTATPTPECPPGYIWHPAMGHCMSTTCPPGLVWNPDTLYCELPTTPTATPTETPTPTPTETPTPTPVISPTPTPTPSCPAGYIWHPVMGHCMSTTCPPGLIWNPDTLYCELP